MTKNGEINKERDSNKGKYSNRDTKKDKNTLTRAVTMIKERDKDNDKTVTHDVEAKAVSHTQKHPITQHCRRKHARRSE